MRKKIKFALLSLEIVLKILDIECYYFGLIGAMVSNGLNYEIIYTLYGFISKFNQSEDPNKITFWRVIFVIYIIYSYKFLSELSLNTIRVGIAEYIHKLYLIAEIDYNDSNDEEDTEENEIIEKYIEILLGDLDINKNRNIFFLCSKFMYSTCFGSFLISLLSIFELIILIIKIVFCIPIFINKVVKKILIILSLKKCNFLAFIFFILYLLVSGPLYALTWCIEKFLNLLEVITKDHNDNIFCLMAMYRKSYFISSDYSKNIKDKRNKRFMTYNKFITTICFIFVEYSIIGVALYVAVLFSNKVYGDDLNTTYQGIFSSIIVYLFSSCKRIYSMAIMTTIQTANRTLLLCTLDSDTIKNTSNPKNDKENYFKEVFDGMKENLSGDIIDSIMEWLEDYVIDLMPKNKR